ncbi:hypothetical protein ACJRO7_005035 [Eucalyptus globulus]|uniref:Uncharacterized protein n=1 Tax=Eucalyptus globulus TaxID=34317 RepID=A0ABD3IYJ7_EUCGL
MRSDADPKSSSEERAGSRSPSSRNCSTWLLSPSPGLPAAPNDGQGAGGGLGGRGGDPGDYPAEDRGRGRAPGGRRGHIVPDAGRPVPCKEEEAPDEVL